MFLLVLHGGLAGGKIGYQTGILSVNTGLEQRWIANRRSLSPSLPPPLPLLEKTLLNRGVFSFLRSVVPRTQLVKKNLLGLRSNLPLSPLFMVVGCHRVARFGRGFIARCNPPHTLLSR